MQILEMTFHSLDFGSSQTFRNLTVTPILANSCAPVDYLSLQEALVGEHASVSEVSSEGVVSTILFSNFSDRPVLLLDGEELVGAKQNRIVNLTVLVPGYTKLELPVSCVEAGRWSSVSSDFCAGDRVLFARGRANKLAQVSESMVEEGARSSRQGEVWADISEKLAAMSVDSETGAMADAYERYSFGLEAFVRAFTAQEKQVGAIFHINNEIAGMELFDSAGVWMTQMGKIIRSYALDAVENELSEEAGGGLEDCYDFVRQVISSDSCAYPALGEGEDIRFSSDWLSGGALIARERLVHLCAFSMSSALRVKGLGRFIGLNDHGGH